MIRARAHGRIGILGNPSDIYYGRVISSTINDFLAESELSQSEKNKFTVNSEVSEGLNKICNAVNSYLMRNNFKINSYTFNVNTNVPKQGGLAGSTAIIACLLGSLNKLFNLNLNKNELAHFATCIEHEEMKVIAGPQDRFVIIYGGAKYMDFSSRNYETYKIEEVPLYDLPIWIAVRGKNVNSGDVHKHPYNVYPNNIELQKIVSKISNCALQGKQAMNNGDAKLVGQLMKQNQLLTNKYGTFGNPTPEVIMQRRIDAELLSACNNENSIIGAKLGGSSGSLIILGEKPEFLLDFKLNSDTAKEALKYNITSESLIKEVICLKRGNALSVN